MMFLRVIGGLWLTALSLSAQAQPWEFSAPILVTDTQGPGIFHHLESSGRHNIAVSAGTAKWVDFPATSHNDGPSPEFRVIQDFNGRIEGIHIQVNNCSLFFSVIHLSM